MAQPKRKLRFAAEPKVFSFDHAAVSADTTSWVWTVPAGRSFRINRVMYCNPTGLAADAANYFAVKILNGAATAASWSTQTSADGALGADVPVALNLQNVNLVVPANTKLSLQLDETGTATLPAGRAVIEGDLI